MNSFFFFFFKYIRFYFSQLFSQNQLSHSIQRETEQIHATNLYKFIYRSCVLAKLFVRETEKNNVFKMEIINTWEVSRNFILISYHWPILRVFWIMTDKFQWEISYGLVHWVGGIWSKICQMLVQDIGLSNLWVQLTQINRLHHSCYICIWAYSFILNMRLWGMILS